MTKRIFSKITLAVFLFGFCFYDSPNRVQAAPPPNLISNNSVETAGTPNTIPLNWSSNVWGNSAATFFYLSSGGQNGSRSVQVNMANHQSGDAKWFFNPVTVLPNSDYIFTDFYQSNVPTRIVVMSLDASGNPTYIETASSVVATSGWTQVTTTIRTLPNTQSLTVFHLIDRNGFLQIDNAKLEYQPPVQLLLIVPNNSMETVSPTNSTLPQYWHQAGWGTNSPTYEYLSSGAQHGSKSLKITMNNYSSGDASWNFAPQQLISGHSYRYRVWYKGNITPQVVARHERADGSEFFFGMHRTSSANSNWQEYTGTFTVPSDAVKTSAYMFIDRNGWLQIDNASLEVLAPAATIVPNPSVETVHTSNNALPANWFNAGWGTNNRVYEYLSTGAQNGTKSVKVTVSNYVDGDASWAFEPQVLAHGADYKFKVWYKTDTLPRVVARYERADGSEYFYGMQDPEPVGTGWQLYEGIFHVPNDAVRVSAYMFISKNGWLQTDNYSITPYQYVPFNRGLVTLVFDDGYEENVNTVIPVLNQYNWKSTQCVATQFIEGDPAQIAKIQSMASAGHEICSHTVTHPALTSIPLSQVDFELTHAQTFLQSITGQPVANFASPYGDYNAAVNTKIAQYHNSHRTTDEGYNSKDGFNKYRLKVQNMLQTTTLSEFQSWVTKAKNDKTWLILVYHVVAPAPTTQFDTIQSDFNAQMQWLSTAGIPVKKWSDTLSEITPQL